MQHKKKNSKYLPFWQWFLELIWLNEKLRILIHFELYCFKPSGFSSNLLESMEITNVWFYIYSYNQFASTQFHWIVYVNPHNPSSCHIFLLNVYVFHVHFDNNFSSIIRKIIFVISPFWSRKRLHHSTTCTSFKFQKKIMEFKMTPINF